MKKRIFAILLALVMLLGVLPVTASAVAVDDVRLTEPKSMTLRDSYGNPSTTMILSNRLYYSQLNVDWPTRGGSIKKAVGDPGTAQMLPQRYGYRFAYYDPYYGDIYDEYTEVPTYYGLPAVGSVEVSNPGVIANCEYNLRTVDIEGYVTCPTICLNYKVVGTGSTDVTMNYYYSYDGSVWYVGQYIFTVYTEGNAPEKPDPPTDEDLRKFHDPTFRFNGGYYDCAIAFYCQQNSYHDAIYFYLTAVPGAYTVGEVEENTGAYTSWTEYSKFTKDKYPWMCAVRLDKQKYLDDYNRDESHYYHYLANGEKNTFTLRFFYNQETSQWECPNGSGMFVPINITCGQSATKDITLSYADEHGDPITGLPNSQTATVTRGEKASFTVAAGPTCDENKHTFASWNTKADGTGTSYAPGATIELSASATLYAQWNDSGSGGGEDDPKTPVGPGEGESESDSGNIDFGDNKITVDCVKNSGHTSLTLPLSKDTIVKNSGTMDTAAGTGSIRIATNYYVNEYVDNAASGRMPHKAKQNEATIPLKWDATKWIVDTEAGIPTIEVECVTTVTPEELAALNIEVNVDCVDENGEDTKAYAVVNDS